MKQKNKLKTLYIKKISKLGKGISKETHAKLKEEGKTIYEIEQYNKHIMYSTATIQLVKLETFPVLNQFIINNSELLIKIAKPNAPLFLNEVQFVELFTNAGINSEGLTEFSIWFDTENRLCTIYKLNNEDYQKILNNKKDGK